MFCKICENFMDITNNISSPVENIENTDKEQVGGGISNLEGIQIESSDYDVSIEDSLLGGSSISDNNVNDLLNGSDVELNIKNFNIDDLNKNSSFNKLSSNQKTLVINRILEKMPKNTKTHKNNEITTNKDSYFYCKSCGYNEKIPKKQFIFSRGDEKKDDIYSSRFINFKYDNTLPYSKKYNCINDSCPTHTKPELKMAVFYRQTGSYNIRYICTICNNYWNTFVEK